MTDHCCTRGHCWTLRWAEGTKDLGHCWTRRWDGGDQGPVGGGRCRTRCWGSSGDLGPTHWGGRPLLDPLRVAAGTKDRP